MGTHGLGGLQWRGDCLQTVGAETLRHLGQGEVQVGKEVQLPARDEELMPGSGCVGQPRWFKARIKAVLMVVLPTLVLSPNTQMSICGSVAVMRIS